MLVLFRAFSGVALYLLAVTWTVWRDPESGPSGERLDWAQRMKAIKSVWMVLLYLYLLLAVFYVFDFWPIHLTFSPTEAAGMQAAGAFLIALSRGSLTFKSTLEVLQEAVRTTATLFTVLIGMGILKFCINLAGLPEVLKTLYQKAGVSPMMVMMIIIGIYIILGCVFESLSMLLLTVLIFFPLVTSLGLIQCGLELSLLLWTETSPITPPVGLNVFVLKAVL